MVRPEVIHSVHNLGSQTFRKKTEKKMIFVKMEKGNVEKERRITL